MKKTLAILLLGIGFGANAMVNSTCPALGQIKYKNINQNEVEIYAENTMGYWSSGKTPKEIKIVSESTKLFVVTDSLENANKLTFIGAPIGRSRIPALWCIYFANNNEEIFLATTTPELLPAPTFAGLNKIEWSDPREWIFGDSSYQLICKNDSNCKVNKLSDFH